ncbi:MAG: AIR synthase-related protein, partial [Planctomycetota bacterium]
ISGKDSLNNEFSYVDPATGEKKTVAIPSSLLISAIGQIADVRRAVTMDLKQAGNLLYLVGLTGEHLGGSHAMFVEGDHRRGNPPTVDTSRAQSTFRSLHRAIQSGIVRSCHDLSEGGLAVALAEMAFAGEFGGQIELDKIPIDSANPPTSDFSRLFSESNSRFVCEIEPAQREAFERAMPTGLCACIGTVEATSRLQITSGNQTVLNEDIFELKRIWQQPLDWS